ncbi:hypothetical protein CFIO01_03040, partial [Colletotrichum fioriniae PJ7]
SVPKPQSPSPPSLSSAVTVPSRSPSLSFRLGLGSGLHAPALALGPVSLNSHRTAPHQHQHQHQHFYLYQGTAATTTAGLYYAPLEDPSILLSFVSCPPLFFSFNLFSTLIFSTQTTLLSLTSGLQHSISSSYYVPSTRSSFSKRSIPLRRRGATAQPFLRLGPPSGFDRFVDTLFAITAQKLFHHTTPTTHACVSLVVFS